MKRTLRRFFILSHLLLLSAFGHAQQLRSKMVVKTDLAQLRKIATEQNQKFTLQHERALQLAKKHNWVISETQANGSFISLQGVTESGRPIYYETYSNQNAAITTNTDKVWSGGASGLNLSGSNSLLSGKLGIWDGGAVRKTHQELTGRIVIRDGSTALNNHATHVAGTMIAKGVYAPIKGMSHGAQNLQAWNFNNDNSEIANAASGLLVSNHSYGNVAGWRYIGTNWYWQGDLAVNDKEDVNFGYYGNLSQLWDNIAFNAPYYLMVKAAGNSRNMAEPAVGQPYYRYNATTGNYELMPGRTADMRYYNGYDLIPDHSAAKNILTVGAIQALPNGYKQPSDAVIFNASSWGPTDDGRIKPDLVGNGISVVSSTASADDAYGYSTGTSMAAPNVSGSLFLLQEHFANRNNGKFMLAATLKGLAIHTTNEAGNAPGPDYIFGWGILNMEQAVKVISNSQQKYQLTENMLLQGQTHTQMVIAGSSEPLRVTISWTDPAGTVLPMVPSTLNNRTPRLVNDLDVRVSSNQNTALPWILDPANPSAPATTGDNIRDNVEQILIANPVPGQAYTIKISHKGTLKNSAQNYSLVVSGLKGIPYCTSGAKLTGGARIENVSIGKINNSSTDCNTYSDFTTLAANAEIGQNIPLTVKLGTCGATANTLLKVFVDWNEDGDFTDAGEMAATSAVLPTSATFTTTITIPAIVQNGNSARMRLVLSETDMAETFSSCGAYEKGETEDYILNFMPPTRDMGIAGIQIPGTTNFYANPGQGVTVKIKNFGTTAQNNIPVSVSVKGSAGAVTTLTGIYTGLIGVNEEKTFTLPGSFRAMPGTVYTIAATTAQPGDLVIVNNTNTATFTTQSLTIAPVVSAVNCDASAPVSLKGSGTTGTLFWYDAPTGGNLLAIGNNTTTTVKLENDLYYAALNEFTGTTASLQNTTPGSFSNFSQDTIYFDTTAPFVLDRATINAGTAGSGTIMLFNPQNILISSSQINIIPGIAQYNVNLTIPAAGNKYRILITGLTDGATVNRHEAAGTVAFPYVTPALLTVTKSSTGGLNLYDWKIKAAGVPSERKETKLNGSITASVTRVCNGNNSGTFTFTNTGTINHWEQSFDGKTWTAFAHTGSSYTFQNLTATTHFRVSFSEGSCSNIYSEPVTVAVSPIPVATILASSSTKLCAGSSLTLTASEGSNFLWSNGQTSQSITVTTPGSYSVQITNQNGCSATSAVMAITDCLTTWTGNTDSNWDINANWSNGIPTHEMDVNIPANATTYPIVLSTTAVCRNITNQGNLTVNGGTLSIGEHFTNNGTLNQNNGLLEFKGTGNHKIIGSTFQNLKVGGPGIKIIDANLMITGNLTIAEGILNTGAHKITLAENATLTESSANHVIGQVVASRSFKSVATHTFGNMGLSLTTTASPSPTIQVTRVTGTTGPAGIRSVNRFFHIHVIEGKTSGLNATLVFTYLPGELNGLLKENLVLYRLPDNTTTWAVQEKSVAAAADYKISLSGISAFSTWTLAERNPVTVLPVSMISFKATRQKQDALITWETALEKGAAGIEIEVSTDTKNYRKIGFIAASGINSNNRQRYAFTDIENGKSGIRYYRIKQLDQDGTFTYYGPRSLSFTELTTLTAYPNPSTGAFALLAQANDAEQMQVVIKNAAGQTIYSARKQLYKGENTVTINLPAGAKPGIYLILARYNNTLHPLKVVVE